MILVTGATGFVGGHVVAALGRAGKQVRCLVRDLRTAAKPELAGCALVEGDMTEPASLASAVEGVECVVHLVAIRQGKAEQFERTKNLVPYYHAKWEMEEAAKGSSVPFVIFRPSFVFAADGGILPTFRKLARLAPVTPIAGSGTQRLQPIWADDV